jgi:putative Mn2+ efflux pump MntP
MQKIKPAHLLIAVICAPIGLLLGKYLSHYPAIAFQWILAILITGVSAIIVKKHFKPKSYDQAKLQKIVRYCTWAGFLALISPLLGFIPSLVAFLIAGHLLKASEFRKRWTIFSGCMLLACVILANIGAVMIHNGML